MNVIKKILTSLISVVLVFCIVLLTISILLNDDIEKQLLSTLTKSAIGTQSDEVVELTDKILNYEGVNEIFDSIKEDYVKSVTENSDSVSEETVNKIVDFYTKNKSEIEKMTGEKININEIQSQETKNQLTKSLNKGLKVVNVDTDKQTKNALTIYSKITSKSFRMKLIYGIIICILLLAAVNISLYKWIKPFGIALTTSGSIVSSIYFVVVGFSNVIKNILNINLDSKPIIIYGLIEIVTGVFLIYLHSFIRKMVRKYKHKQEKYTKYEEELIEKNTVEKSLNENGEIVDEVNELDSDDLY